MVIIYNEMGEKVNIDITKLKSGLEKIVDIDENYTFSKEQLQNTTILELKDIHITGDITYHLDNFHLYLQVEGTMVLPCSISLKPVNYPFSIEIDEDLDEDLEQNLKNVQNSLDILPIVWENILMEVPLRVVSNDLTDVPLEGDGWCLITEDEN